MNDIWNQVIDLIEKSLSKQNFDTWIRPLRFLGIEEDVFRLGVPNRFFKDWITDHYLDLIRNSVKTVQGKELVVEISIHHGKMKGDNPPQAASPAEGKRVPENERRLKQVNPSLNPNYSFERFVVGPSNQFAHATSVAVAEKPAKNYNPLFIYGGVGLGKTHLLNAIGLHTINLYPHMNVLYISAEAFMNEMINCIRYDKMQSFRDKYRNIDCLLMDDIQFIAGKERTQEEFFHTFNSLHDTGKQIVVTSDKFPKEIPNLEDRLRSRFEWGLIADIQPPETETKVAIIKKKTQENNIDLPDSVAYYIASHSESNIREIEGFLLRIVAYASLKERPIDTDLVREVLKNMIRRTSRNDLSIDEIVKAVAAKTGVKVSDIKSPKKNKQIALSRQIAMYLARKITEASFPDIGEKIGGRDHSTVIHACHKMEKVRETDPGVKRLMDEIEDLLRSRY